MSLSINGTAFSAIHFTGIFGSGMSALAQYCSWIGLNVSGSDRLNDSIETETIRKQLISCGCSITPQDGSGIINKSQALCISTAIEETNPDIIEAHKKSTPIIHRSDLLAAISATKKTVAVAGTSGKSTVTAMIFEFLTYCGKAPSLISGAGLKRLECQDLIGNAFLGKSDYLIIEADESDGTLVKYHPYATVLLNISKDHKPINEVHDLFKKLIQNSTWSTVLSDEPLFRDIPFTSTFSLAEPADWKPDHYKSDACSGTLVKDEIIYSLPVPGKHNLSNLAAALSLCDHLGCNKTQLQKAVASFQGVARRFEITKAKNNVTVIDDFAHNPEKVKAAVSTAQEFSVRVHALFQPHGFGPTRFLKNEFASTFRSSFRTNDSLYLLPIYYAGGTAAKDISSANLATLIGNVQFDIYLPESREILLSQLKNNVKPGDVILVMGARDPSLSSFVKQIVDLFDTI